MIIVIAGILYLTTFDLLLVVKNCITGFRENQGRNITQHQRGETSFFIEEPFKDILKRTGLLRMPLFEECQKPLVLIFT